MRITKVYRRALALAVLLYLGLSAASRADRYVQCDSYCQFLPNTENCQNGPQSCAWYYATYVQNYGDNVAIVDYQCCLDSNGNPIMVPGCDSTTAEEDASCDNTCEQTCPCQCFSWGCDWECSHSPILIDLDGRAYQMTGLNDPVQFDLNADGTPDTLGWTARGTRQGFLWLDRNGNSVVDNGAELFGNHTPLTGGGTAGNGFRGLAEFDQPELGGNADGVIDSRDAIFQQLKIWIDANHNGISEPNEILSLSQAGVTRIDLKYKEVGRQDQFGNRFRFKGTALITDGRARPHPTVIYDVFFVSE